MDPVSVGLLAALAAGAGGEVGREAWAGLTALVRRPFGRRGGDGNGVEPAVSTGEAELTRLAQNPADPNSAQALSTALAVRAALDTDFRTALAAWHEQAHPALAEVGSVHNSISGGVQHGPVLQGRNFSGLAFTQLPPSLYAEGGRAGAEGTAG
jgi:hypothetical protein